MKKRLSFLLLCGVLPLALCSQSSVSFAQLYNRFAHEKKVEKVSVGGVLMWLAKPLMQKQLEGMDISNVEVLSLDESPQEVKQRFNAMAEKMNDNRYEVLLKTNDKAEKTRIFARVENDIIRELIIISMGEEPALVRLKGKIQPQEIQKLTKSKQNE